MDVLRIQSTLMSSARIFCSSPTPNTMSDTEDVKFSLSVLVNKQRTKVLYAEVESDFADILLSFLSLPLGTIVRILGKHYGDESPVVGSLTTLYKSLSNLNNDLFCTESCKLMLLNPRKSLKNERCKLKLNVDDTPSTKYFRCPDKDCSCKRTPNVGLYYDTSKCDCGKSTLSYDMGIVMDLLKWSLLSETPLTDVILNKGLLSSITVKCETYIFPVDQAVEQSSSNDKKMTVKAITQESTNKLLFVEADGNFVDFLFSLFTIPLGAVECLLGITTGLKNIDNLYRSLGNIITDDKYLDTQDTKTMLLEPELPTGYVSKDKILPLIEETLDFTLGGGSVSFKSPKGSGNYVKQQKMYMVTDDLTVTLLCMASSISIFNQLKVPLYDVKELKLDIGPKEALGILKASLTSNSALTDGLMIKPTSRKKPKLEHA
ncbi:hypothetical protein CASFOL_020005 [Castilleja foliolosa]|uniref:DUF674 family protein n=1 Tax=Castilleja foliolosa TaxID=1961234 RepID=A0ABD3CZM8_9LAMI